MDFFSLTHKQDLYNRLTHSIRAGRVTLDIEPSPALLGLPNPYDPQANAGLRLHDASLYKGHYFVYFGITPVLTAFLPVHLLTGGDLSEGAACFLFATGGYIISSLLFLHFARRFPAGCSGVVRMCALTSLGIAQFIPYVLKRPYFYEAAATCGFAFSSAGLCALVIGIDRERHRRLTFSISGLCLGLSVGARPNYVLGVASLVFLVWCVVLLPLKVPCKTVTCGDAAVFVAPIIACGLGLAAYNYTRFDNPLEFGIKYQLTEANGFSGFHLSTPKTLLGVFYFLLSAPGYSRSFPFCFAMVRRVGSESQLARLVLEQVVGMLPAVPITIIGLLAPLGILVPFLRERLRVECLPLLSLWIFAASNLLVLCASGWTTVRYSVDFVPGFLLVTWLCVIVVQQKAPYVTRHIVTTSFYVVTSVYSISIGMALGITGYYEGTLFSHPVIYQKIANTVSHFTGGSFLSLSLQVNTAGTLRFPVKPNLVMLDPLLTAGHAGSATFMAVRYFSPTSAAISYQLWGAEETLGQRFVFQPDRDYGFQLQVGPGNKRVQVRLDEKIVFDKSMMLNPTRVDEIVIGFNPIWRFHRKSVFSGTLSVSAETVYPNSEWIR